MDGSWVLRFFASMAVSFKVLGSFGGGEGGQNCEAFNIAHGQQLVPNCQFYGQGISNS